MEVALSMEIQLDLISFQDFWIARLPHLKWAMVLNRVVFMPVAKQLRGRVLISHQDGYNMNIFHLTEHCDSL